MESNNYDRANDLNVQQLCSFCTVFEQRSYSAAARVLGIAVPTIWEQVQAVERCYGANLFSREGRQIAPTQTAHSLYEALGPVMAGLHSTFDVVNEEEHEGSARLTIVTGMRMLLEELGDCLQTFRNQHPTISLRLVHGDNKTAERLILAEEADLGMTLEPGPNSARTEFTYDEAYTIEYLAVVPTNHPLAKRRSLKLKDLVAYPLVVGHEQTAGRRVLDEALHREGLLQQANVAVETDNSAFTATCVRAGMGVGILAGKSDGLLTRDLVGLSLKKQLGNARIVFLWRSGRHLTRATRSLIQLIKEQRAGH
jgi:DNA-binding transcriptional LysR family regulator